jgi:parallel beta-helix repeat protein
MSAMKPVLFMRPGSILLFPVLAATLSISWGANYYQGVTSNNVPWPGGIVPYVFTTNVSPAEQVVYLEGMKEWELAANVQFVPRTTQDNYAILDFDFEQGTNTYYASVPAVMTVDNLSRAQVCHETGHLLGFQHEHVRIDRDSYITVNFENIESSGSTNGSGEGSGNVLSLYLIDSNSTPNGAYDFESVMHYGRTLFSIDPETLDVIDPLPAFTYEYYNRIGNFALSVGDRAGASYLYGPPANPPTNIVTTTADGGPGSLRAAIYYANGHPGTTVSFNIPTDDPGLSNGVYTIYVSGQLPPLVSDGTVIDATTQPGYAGSPIVALDASQVLPETEFTIGGIYIYAGNCVLRGLIIDNFTDSGINLLYNLAASNQVQGCYIGLAGDGLTAAPNQYEGVNIGAGAQGNVIGGANAGQRNLISGNAGYGITITATNSNGNAVLGNYIGLDATGTFAVSNAASGIGIWGGSSSNMVGGANAGARNVISGNFEYGVYIGDSNTTDTVVQGNYVGTDATGDNPVPNSYGGVGAFNGAHNVTVGGTNAGAGNVLSGNVNAGLWFSDEGTTNNVAQGNFIGVNAGATAAVSNTVTGIYVVGGSSSNLIANNVLSGNFSYGLYISDPGTSRNVVQGNFIGTDAQGVNALPNGYTGIGIWSSATDNLIGGTTATARNIISGNGQNGISMGGAGSGGNVIEGNYIGVASNGLSVLPNVGVGVYVETSLQSNVIGTNIISGNTYGGIDFYQASNNVVQGNAIGVAVDGVTAAPNGGIGIYLYECQSNLIGGAVAGTGNVVSANLDDGIQLFGPGTSYNTVAGNLVGTTRTGLSSLGNSSSALSLISGPTSNTIGGVTAAARNLFSGSSNYDGVYIDASSNNVVEGNFIGTDASGLTAFPNGQYGLTLFDSSQSNQITGNVIAASVNYGVAISDPGTSGNLIQGNEIGVGVDGATALGNGWQGVMIENGASNNTIGLALDGSGAGNVIADNVEEGVILYDTNTIGNSIRGNSIFGNGAIGINLVGGVENSYGVTANHVGGAEPGPNHLENYPVLTAAAVFTNSMVIAGTMNSGPGRNVIIDIYYESSPDPSSHGQGRTYAGATIAQTDAEGNGSFSLPLAARLAGQYFTATATDAVTGDTSEFSLDVQATNTAGPGPGELTAFSYSRGNGFSFGMTLATNQNYTVQVSTNLSTIPVLWMDLTNFFATNPSVQILDGAATNSSARFYRAVTP